MRRKNKAEDPILLDFKSYYKIKIKQYSNYKNKTQLSMSKLETLEMNLYMYNQCIFFKRGNETQ